MGVVDSCLVLFVVWGGLPLFLLVCCPYCYLAPFCCLSLIVVLCLVACCFC